jgi:hypothetical protein
MVLILISGGLFLYFNKNSIRADSNLGTFKSEKKFNLILNNKNFKFIIKSYSSGGVSRNYLIIDNIFKIKQVQLLGYEDDFNLCNRPIIKLRKEELICLIGDVGVHSQTIAFFNKNLNQIEINKKDDNSRYLVTDIPSYQIQDYNSDGFDDLIVEDRNYDKNPIVDIIRKYYSGRSDNFVFDKEEYIEVK